MDGTLRKFQLFWEGHKILRNLPRGFDIYLVNLKTMRKFAQIFVAFSEKLYFKESKNPRPWRENITFKYVQLLLKKSSPRTESCAYV